MVKKITTISIDEDILRLAKKELPNFSIFVEDCLKSYFGYNDHRIRTIDENLTVIKNAMLNIQLASVREAEIEINEAYTKAEQNKAWISVWGAYRNNQSINPNVWEESSKILGLSVRELQELVEKVEFEVNTVDLVKCNQWSFILDNFVN